MLINISFFLLACSTSISVILLSLRLNHQQRLAITAALSGFALVAIASWLVLLDSSFALTKVHVLFNNAATFLGLPLIAMGYLSLYLNMPLKQSSWLRIILGCMVFFELMRRFNLLFSYQIIIYTVFLLSILFSAYKTSGFFSWIFIVSLLAVLSFSFNYLQTIILYYQPPTSLSPILISIIPGLIAPSYLIWSGCLFKRLEPN